MAVMAAENLASEDPLLGRVLTRSLRLGVAVGQPAGNVFNECKFPPTPGEAEDRNGDGVSE